MRVYHLLPAKFALEDLQQRRLKIARLDELNDPFELSAAKLANRDDRRAFRAYRQAMAEKYGILCFSRNWRNPVLWTHYAEKHAGICLGFEVADSVLMNIIYTETRVDLGRASGLRPEDLNPQVAERLLSTKFRDWCYEDEVRVFLRLTEPDAVTGFYFHEFDENIRLREVIAGHRCELTREVLDRAVGSDPMVDVVKARLAFKTFWVVRDKRGFGAAK